MGKEPSSISSNATPPSSSSAADSYIGRFISVTLKSEIRCEGVPYYVNPENYTFGLKDVRLYGTEGRKKDGQQVPPSDKVYKYIRFHASDIKNLQFKTTQPVQREQPIYNDPAIIQSNYSVGPSSSSKSVSPTGGSSTEFNLHSELSASNARSYASILPSHHSPLSSYGLPAQWQRCSVAPGSTAGTQQPSISSSTVLYSLQNQASKTIAMTNLPNNVSPGHSLATSGSINSNSTPTLTSEQMSVSFTDSLSVEPSVPFHHSTLVNPNRLTTASTLIYQNSSDTEAQVVDKVVPVPVSLLPVQSLPNSTSSTSDPISDLLLRQQQALLTPSTSQPKLSEHSPAKSLRRDQKDKGVMSSISQNLLSSATTPAIQPPSEKLRYSFGITEEFDFQAMNEKFKKDKVWGCLGKANQRDKVEGIQENTRSSQDSGVDNPDLVSKSYPKLAYKKHNFFDTIIRNSICRRAGIGQNRSDRVKLDSETFGDFQQRTQLGYGRHRVGRGEHHGPYNWCTGYKYGKRSRWCYMQR